MSFTYTANTPAVAGSKRLVTGTYTNTSGSTGGAMTTGLNTIESFSSSNSTQSATTNQAAFSGGTVTLTTVANETGKWEAIGY